MAEANGESATRRPRGPRDPVAGPEAGPEAPFPIKLSGPVIKGFGRGSRELGIPTANIPATGLTAYPDLASGVYFGFVGLLLAPHTVQSADNSGLALSAAAAAATEATAEVTAASASVYPAVLSIGYNPYYKNEARSIEIHILHHFPHYNFYGSPLNLLLLGHIRPEYDYDSLDALVADIRTDCQVARASLARPAWAAHGRDAWLTAFAWAESGAAAAAAAKADGQG